ncbi:hypothetical protein WBG78_07300 [Chryseolinea sp. T2]|uniref:tetratricopeptide repeat protein n=1 Tax=Chryseolinea sp. T2 TaxID=3129255 RepID=UPI0030775F00
MKKGNTNMEAVDKKPFPKNRSRLKRPVGIYEIRRRLNDFAENEEWDEIVAYIQSMLTARPRDHWLLTQIALAFLLKKDYSGALVYAADALTIEFSCPLAQVIFANAMAALGQRQDALEFYEALIRRGTHQLVHGKCGTGSDCNINPERAHVLIEEAQAGVYQCTSETAIVDEGKVSRAL